MTIFFFFFLVQSENNSVLYILLTKAWFSKLELFSFIIIMKKKIQGLIFLEERYEKLLS